MVPFTLSPMGDALSPFWYTCGQFSVMTIFDSLEGEQQSGVLLKLSCVSRFTYDRRMERETSRGESGCFLVHSLPGARPDGYCCCLNLFGTSLICPDIWLCPRHTTPVCGLMCRF